jgi:4Fe-4S ferredoxin
MTEQKDCAFGPGEVVPVIDRERCENKGTCARVCPYGVLTIQKVPDGDKQALSWKGRLRLWAHGGEQAYATFADRCHGCGLCVAACPEKAITLEKRL